LEHRVRALSLTIALGLCHATTAVAQTSRPAGPPEPPASAATTAPVTTTFDGDTGLWYVPTAEVLPRSGFSASGYRRGFNYVQGYTNVADFAGTIGYGLTDRLELFGSFIFDTRIDRDVRPIFVNDPAFGGVVDRYPRVNTTWTGDTLGDFGIGAKFNVWSESRRNPAAVAVRGIVKLPTGGTVVSTGRSDFSIDAIASKELRQAAEVSGYAGYEAIGSPDEFDLPGGAFRWGVGAAFPSRSPLRVITELNGRVSSTDTVTSRGGIQDASGLQPPATSTVQNLTVATAGLTYQAANGFFVGGGLSWTGPSRARDLARASDDATGDYWDWQVRIGYHPGARARATATSAAAPPPPPAPAAPPPPSAPASPTAPAAPPASPPAAPPSRAPESPATPAARPESAYVFEDVHFDFDRYSLRLEATRMLDEVVRAFASNPSLRMTIEGHTCNIGTAEYNLALGSRRATSVRDYLVGRGVPADRLTTISYGEERPKYDNSREDTRRLNRRAALVVRIER
jgi:peptidoglycan-associated lipoprotein